jgi:poly[(R)-3-hydroxyalkanoate] polymerase subunit PhaE
MSDKKQKYTNEIDWTEFQKKYFDALMAFNPSSSFNNNLSANSFWSKAMEDWWKSMKMDSGMENQALFDKVIEQSRNYYFMGEQFSSLIEGLTNLKNKDTSGFINNKFKEFESMFTQPSFDFSWSSFIDDCEFPYDWMKNNVLSNGFDISDLFGGDNSEMKKMREQFLSMPGIGYYGVKQEKIQKLIKLSTIYQDNYSENQTVMTRLNNDALELMRKKILRMSKQGEDFNSMRQIYDLWVESNEKVYADYAYTEEYSDLNGRLVNSQMALKRLSQEMTEDMLSAMNMPTTRAMNDLERRHYELRKKFKFMESELKNLKETINKQSASKDELVIKTKQVSTTRKKTKKKSASSTSKVAKKKSVSRKTAVKKKVAKKKAKRKSSTAKKDVIEIKF